MIPADSPNAIAKNLLLKDLVKRAIPLPIPVLNPANVAKANPRYISVSYTHLTLPTKA